MAGDRLVLASDGLGPLWTYLGWKPTVPEQLPDVVTSCLRTAPASILLDMAEESEKALGQTDDKTVVVVDFA